MSIRTLTGRTRVAGVIGWPVSHSLSPRLHGFWLDHHKIDGVYAPFPVPEAEAERAIRSLAALGLAGVNVTVPHKETALACMDSVTATARRIGAVNTVVVREDGSLHGDNTDGFGFLENVRRGQPTWEPRAAPVLVLGAGGSARAVCAALLDAGVPELRLTNRTEQRAHQVANDLSGPVTIIPWERKSDALEDVSLLVNTTTLGMGSSPGVDLEFQRLLRSCVVTDLVYVPLITPLLAEAAQWGNPIVDGLGMLLHQARPGFAAWFGVEPNVTEELRTFVLGGG